MSNTLIEIDDSKDRIIKKQEEYIELLEQRIKDLESIIDKSILNVSELS